MLLCMSKYYVLQCCDFLTTVAVVRAVFSEN